MGAAGEAGMMNNSMAVPTHNPVILPNYSMYTGTPNHVANMKLRSNVPSFIAENELKMEVLKRQHICQAQVSKSITVRTVLVTPLQISCQRFLLVFQI